MSQLRRRSYGGSVVPAEWRAAPAPPRYGAAPPPPPAADAKLGFADIVAALRDGKWVILLTTLAVAGAVAAYTYTVEPTYEATAIVRIGEPAGVRSASQMVVQRPLSGEIAFLENAVDVASLVVDDLKLGVQQSRRPDWFPFLEDHGGDSKREQQAEILDRMEFVPNQAQAVITLRARSSSPQEAAVIATRFAQQYQRASRAQSRAALVSARQYVDEQVLLRKQDMDRIGSQLVGVQQSNPAATSGTGAFEIGGLIAQADQFSAQEQVLQLRRQQLQNQLGQAQSGMNSNLASTIQTGRLQSQLAGLQGQVNELRARAEVFYQRDPSLRNQARLPQGYAALEAIRARLAPLESQLADVERQLIAEQARTGGAGAGALGNPIALQQQLQQIDIELRGLQRQRSSVESRIGQTRGTLQAAPAQNYRVGQIQSEFQLVQGQYMSALAESQRLRIEEESELGYVSILREAFVPPTPVAPNIPQNLTLGTLLGLVFGIALAFARKSMNHTLRSVEDIQDNGYTLLGVIPPMHGTIKQSFNGKETIEIEGRTRSTKLMPLLDPWSPIAENYRLVRTNLQYLSRGGQPQVLLVTSPSMGDGKTVTSTNLALTTAQSGLRTLLIEADLRRPGAARLLGFNARHGLAEILEGGAWPALDSDDEAEAEALFYPYSTDVDHLWFIGAGSATVPPAELFGAGTMRALLASAKRAFDVVIVDSPPVLAVTDAVILAPMCDAVVLIVSNDKTDLRALEVTRQTLGAVGAKIAGVVINGFNAKHSGTYSYGYYKDGYGPDGKNQPLNGNGVATT